ncbi:MAG: ribosome maturation factor RimM [Actinobacteria bacterium]|nr:ribosome maturation factor RimM [Actinomycetota bacterium]
MSQKNIDVRLIGVIGKPHGIKGELNVMMVTDYPNTILKGSRLFMDQKCSVPVEVAGIRCKKLKGREVSIVKLAGIDDRSAAERLKGKDLYRSGGEAPVLEDGQFRIDELTGCRVFLSGGTPIGRVEDVEVLASNENLAVFIDNNKITVSGIVKNILYVPLIEDYIDNIDISGKKIIIKKLPEYI